MDNSFYESTIKTAKAALLTLDHVLAMAEKSPDAANLLHARLIDNMKPLTFQVHMVTRTTQYLMSRLMSRDAVPYTNDLTTYSDMHGRIAETITALDRDTSPMVVEQNAGVYGIEQLGPLGPQNITNRVFAFAVAMPNIQFHTAMAYAILRKGGLPLEKSDYIPGFMAQHFTLSQH